MKTIIKPYIIEQYFNEIPSELTNSSNKKKALLTWEWTKLFPDEAGTYLVFENDKLKYVGETGNIKGRIADLLNTKNHTLRRTLGETYFSNVKGYAMASSQKSFVPDIELQLNNFIKMNLTISWQTLEIGRKEFEEWVIEKHTDTVFYNKRKKKIH
ncbi:MAG: GIY-YIG nuclease family protein [Bacteroidetes bacterium]|nr:GIY-YIG nuclease family protein [Bacteroidota bacterium]